MAANYWDSTQRLHWTFSKAKLQEMRRKLEEEDRNLIQQNPIPERRLLSIHFCHQITKLGKRLNVRQQALATAQVYVRRFYTRVEIRRTNPYLVLATAFYLACKMEECPQHIRLVVGEARNTWPGKRSKHNSTVHFTNYPRLDLISSDISKLGECEFWLISEMNSQLIIHHPYRSLTELQSSFPLTQDETALAWSVINDHYLTDLPLLYPPHVIAITAAFLAVVLRPTQSTLQVHAASAAAALQSLSNTQAANGPRIQKLVDWMAEGSVDIEAVVDCMQELISLYEVWEQFNDKVCKEQIARFVKSRGLDN